MSTLYRTIKFDTRQIAKKNQLLLFVVILFFNEYTYSYVSLRGIWQP